MYSVICKRVFTPLQDLLTRKIEAVDHSSNSKMAFAFTKNPNANAIVEFEECSTASIIRVGRSQRGVKTLL